MERPCPSPFETPLIYDCEPENPHRSTVRILSYYEISPNLGRIMGGVPMAGHTHAKLPKRERTIDGTTYIVTSHFKQTGSTAADHVRRLIDIATKERKVGVK